jgi:cytochrome c556
MGLDTRSARPWIVAGVAVVISASAIAAAFAQNPPANAGPSPTKQAVENRRAAFTLVGNSFRYFGAVTRGVAPFDAAEAKKRADRIAFLSGLIGENFPEGSNVGEPDSKAKTEIWSDRADFDKKLKDFQIHAAALAEVAGKEQSATEAFKTAVAAVGQDCKGCHDSYKLK